MEEEEALGGEQDAPSHDAAAAGGPPGPDLGDPPPPLEGTWRSYASLRRAEGLALRPNPVGVQKHPGSAFFKVRICVPGSNVRGEGDGGSAGGGAHPANWPCKDPARTVTSSASQERCFLAWDVAQLWRAAHRLCGKSLEEVREGALGWGARTPTRMRRRRRRGWTRLEVQTPPLSYSRLFFSPTRCCCCCCFRSRASCSSTTPGRGTWKTSPCWTACGRAPCWAACGS